MQVLEGVKQVPENVAIGEYRLRPIRDQCQEGTSPTRESCHEIS